MGRRDDQLNHQDIYFVAQFLGQMRGGIGRYEQSLYTHLEQEIGAALIPIEPWPIPRLLLNAARIAGQDLRALTQNYPCYVPKSGNARMVHLSHQNLALSLLFQRFERAIVTVHDIFPYVQLASQQFGAAEMTGFHERLIYKMTMQGLHRANRIITDSYQTKRDLIDHLGIPESSIDVVPLGVDRRVFRRLPFSGSYYSRYGLDPSEQYILYVGSQAPRKNLPIIYSAICELHKRNKNIRLLIVGAPRSLVTTDLCETLLQRTGVEQLVRFFGFVTEHDLVFLYNLSQVLVLPSLYEGFGLPALEAMACGCPVIASNVTSLPEVVGDAGILVNPHDVNGWITAISEVLENESLRKQVVERGLDRVRRFTWEATAEATIAVYRQVLT